MKNNNLKLPKTKIDGMGTSKILKQSTRNKNK